jgi:hypothetical protein
MTATGSKALTRSQQLRQWGASVQAQDDRVVLQVGADETTFNPEEAQAFAYYLARAYYRANLVREAAR